jgi:FkbM family methyltransferase
MIPFQAHRRIPFIRRPFWQRDQAVAERNAARARCDQLEIERDEALSALDKITTDLRLTAAKGGRVNDKTEALPKDAGAYFTIPPEFAAISIAGDGETNFRVVVEASNPPSYDLWVSHAKPYSEIARLLIKMLRGNGTLIDLGANIGTVSLPVAVTGSRVIAIEMLPRNVMKLTLSAALNRLPHFRVIQAAVTDRDGIVGYAGDEAWAKVSTENKELQAVGLQLDTIMDLIELDSPSLLHSPVVMKIDIEGHELAALRGAERFLAKYRPAFVFESIQLAQNQPDKARQVKDLVIDHGYNLHMIRGAVLSPHLADDPQIGVVSDILAIPIELQDAFFLLLTDFEMRPLSASENLEWLKEMCHHKQVAHVTALLPQLRHRFPELDSEIDLIMPSLLKTQEIDD